MVRWGGATVPCAAQYRQKWRRPLNVPKVDSSEIVRVVRVVVVVYIAPMIGVFTACTRSLG